MASRPIENLERARVRLPVVLAQSSRSAPEEASLVAEARAGNGEAFADLLGHSDRSAYQLAMKITCNREDAEDALQEALCKAYVSLDRFQQRSCFSTWFGRIAANEALMCLRKRRSERQVSLEELNESPAPFVAPQEVRDPGERPEESCFRRELQSSLADAILSLEPRYRQVFLLREVTELSTIETARKLHLSGTTVKSRLRQARFELRQRLAEAW